VSSEKYLRKACATVSNARQKSQAEAQAPSGLIFNVMRFALHDGPGIRTTVFMKGCPLACWWCHNPESQASEAEVTYSAESCIVCRECCDACDHGALHWDGSPAHDSSRCELCGECAKACPTEARRLIGRRISVAELMNLVRRDVLFFDESAGGVTFSGGEPLAQPHFLEAALKQCKAEDISTVVDTCGYASSDTVLRIAQYTDLFLYDLKLMDAARHRDYTGVSNEPILANLSLVAQRHGRLIVRIPIIPGVNDDESNITASIRFLAATALREVHLLPYHRAAAGKYYRLQSIYRMEDVVPPSSEQVSEIANRFSREGFEVHIGGWS
jgi:pyruvate formate lyase activating enzyme